MGLISFVPLEVYGSKVGGVAAKEGEEIPLAFDFFAPITAFFTKAREIVETGALKGVGVFSNLLLPLGFFGAAYLVYELAPKKFKLISLIPAVFGGISLYNIGAGLISPTTDMVDES